MIQFSVLVLPLLIPLLLICGLLFLMHLPIKTHRARWVDYVHKRIFESAATAPNAAQKASTSGARKRTEALLLELDAAVIVCGDIARSPRMQYHAVSLCDIFGQVSVVGSSMGNRCCDDLEARRKDVVAAPVVASPASSNFNGSSGPSNNPLRAPNAVFCLVEEDEETKASSAQGKKQSWVVRVVKRVFSLFARYYSAVWAVCSSNDNLSFILCQTPPVLPTLPIVVLVVFFVNFRRAIRFKWESTVSMLSGSRPVPAPPLTVVFDVHNLGWTILKAEKRPRPFVFLYWLMEWVFVASGMFCNGRTTISDAMGRYLVSSSYNQNSKAERQQQQQQQKSSSLVSCPVAVMPDSAPNFFRPSSREELWREVFASTPPKFEFGGLGENTVPAWFADREMVVVADAAAQAATETEAAAENELEIGGGMRQREGSGGAAAAASLDAETEYNTLFVAGSTSWTADDDYSIVIDAMKIADAALKKLEETEGCRKQLWVFVSGKGPSRSVFEDAVREAGLNRSRHVAVTTGYFQSFSHYALFLGAADVGLCMHCSSSGLDLPMKGVDMLGAGLPICALRYEPALSEMVTGESGSGGWIFSQAEELARIWLDLLGVTAAGSLSCSAENDARKELQEKRAVVRARRQYWSASWKERMALPVVATQVLTA